MSLTSPVFNNYSDNKIVPETDLYIKGYCQNVNLFIEFIEKIPKYLNLNDSFFIDYINKKYGDISNSICIGIRIGNDFKNMTKLKSESYIKAINYFKDRNENIDNIFILSDVPNINKNGFDIDKHFNYTEVNEKDIIQFYFGLMCKNYILSESTFHLWIAYLGTLESKDKNVICFNNTDITNRNLNLKNWITIDF